MGSSAVSAQAEVLNADQVADLLGVGRNSVYEAANRGEIPHRRVGKRLIFSRTAVMEWLQGKAPANQ
jgi:excisionase family DNA binding protein